VSGIAVDVVDVSKRFRLYHQKYQSLKERVLHAGNNPYEDFWALRNVGFDVAEGHTVGILGRNGSGKSTLLKCISGILQPTTGKVVIRGQLAALLELGAGFQPELSGRENIYLNASLLGISRRETERRFDEIVAFAELEQFIDNQVKFYSSGMYVRLGFAVAVSVDPDILVVDEVLAVGDENFQRKCMARIKEFQAEGRTILFVTHAADMVRMICDRAVVLNAGETLVVGEPAEAVRLYHDELVAGGPGIGAAESSADGATPRAPAYRPVVITAVTVEHPGVGARRHMLPQEPLTVSIAFEAFEPVPGLVFSLEIFDTEGNVVFGSDTEIIGQPYDAPAGGGRADLIVDHVPLQDGSYMVKVQIRDHLGIVFDAREQPGFDVMNPGRTRGWVALNLRADIRAASLH
jgi:ABC-2 type transport system ATP-binding protein